MTITEAILSFPGLADMPENYIAKVLIDRSISDGTADYDLTQKETVELCAADCYMAIVNSPDFSEGKLSIKMSRESMLSMARSLYLNNGEAANANKAAVGRGYAKANWW
jgi:hypothetical protein